jgi:hypothetical protein
MKKTFSRRLEEAVAAAIAAINSYQGPGRVRLATGEHAIDNDDAWIILREDPDESPLCRDKREQRLREKEGDAHKIEWEDYRIRERWSAETVCRYADQLLAKAGSARKY